MNALQLKDVSKSFSSFQLSHLDLSLLSGCIMGLIGENGAGKSTVIKLILDILYKDSGTITLFGRDHTQSICLTKQDIGVVMDDVGIPDTLNAFQVGKIMRHTYTNWEPDTYAGLLRKLSIPEKKPFKDYSRGMRMKLGFAVAMSHRAKLLLLDEATGGLDPVVRDEVVSMLHDFTRDADHSILISSHIVSDLEKLCDYIAFLHQGRLLVCEEKDVLLGKYGILHCSEQQLEELDSSAVLHKKVSQYGVEAIVDRGKVPNTYALSPISIEELFLAMIKEAN